MIFSGAMGGGNLEHGKGIPKEKKIVDFSWGKVCTCFYYIYTYIHTNVRTVLYIFTSIYTKKDPEVDLKAISRNRRYEL